MFISTVQPAIPDFRAAFSTYWNKSTFSGQPSDDRATNAHVFAYMRLVESCLAEYRSADVDVRDFWDAGSSLKLSVMHRAISHYETCIANAQRAIRCFNKLRASRHLQVAVQQELKAHKHSFHTDKVANRLGDVRDLFHHFDTAVGEVSGGQPIVLKPTGPIEPVDETDQTVKTIDRLQIGPHVILLSDLAKWLTEMGECAEIISRFYIEQPNVINAFVHVT